MPDELPRARGRMPWMLAAAASVLLGLGLFAFVYARGASYLTDSPEACVNCHVMRPQYEGWQKGSHHAVAVCNDCHTPAGLIPKYATKAKSGLRHAWAFTTGRFSDEIRIKPDSAAVAEAACGKCHAAIVEEACRRCHGELSSAVDGHAEQERCVRCHGSVGHMR